MSELPPEDEELIDADQTEHLIIPIAEILYSGDRAWYTKDQINIRLKRDYNQDPSNPTIDKRLSRLQELELVKRKRIGQTDIFYYKKESDWPIPPDVAVEKKELTVNELIRRVYVVWAGVAIFAIFVGGLIVLISSLQILNIVQLPFTSSELLAVSLLVFMSSYTLILLAITVGFLDYATDMDLPEVIT